jgi:hypothetical protein
VSVKVFVALALCLSGCSVLTDFFHEKYSATSLTDGGIVSDDGSIIPLATCGNGVTEAPLEDCDPPNADGGCSSFCRTCAYGEKNVADATTGHCYSLFGISMTSGQQFTDAATACDRLGGTIVTIGDPAEANSVGMVFDSADTDAHIGLLPNSAGIFTNWYNGEVVHYECWPNNCSMTQPSAVQPTDCIESQGGLWRVLPTTTVHPYICEVSGWLYNAATNHAFLPLAKAADCVSAESNCNTLSKRAHLATITAGDADDTFLRQRNVVTETLTVNDANGCSSLVPASVDAGVASYSGYLCEVK